MIILQGVTNEVNNTTGCSNDCNECWDCDNCGGVYTH